MLLTAAFWLLTAEPASCSREAMNGPPEQKTSPPAVESAGTSVVRIALLGAIEFYRTRISPIGGSRCGFNPTCSAFGLQAMKDEGAFVGLMMTADRLTRCNIFKGAGADYLLLPDGRLFDPVSNNTLSR